MTAAKRRMAMDALIRWAWSEELPKAQPIAPTLPSGISTAWNSVAHYASLMANVQEPDIRNRYGVVPDFTADRGGPHPDATTIWWQVQDLAHLTLTLFEDWNPIEDLELPEARVEAAVTVALDRLCFRVGREPRVEPVGQSTRRWRRVGGDQGYALRKSATEVVLGYASRGSIPEWKTEQPALKTVTENGKPKWFRRDTIITETGSFEVELDGMDRKQRRPYGDAYLKHYYDPDPADIVEMRAEYEIWHAALTHLVEQLGTSLSDFEPLPLELSARPWMDGTPPEKRILGDLRPRQPLVREPRPSAGPPPFRGIKRARGRRVPQNRLTATVGLT